MKNLLIIIGLIIILSAFASLKTRSTPSPKQAKTYRFRRKQFIMTKAENDFYRALQAAVGSHYMIYPQAHLDLFLDHKVEKQSRKGALSTIQRKSVDFLICNRQYYNPLVAIELDDGSHARPERKERDEKVDAICVDAGMPLVHFKWQQRYNEAEILSKLSPYLT